MEKVKKISENSNYTALNIGKLDDLMEHSLIHPVSGSEIKGKVFLKDATKATGTEISFQVLPPYADQCYFHVHKENEETYIIVKGEGEYQVDDDCFPVSEGAVIRVAPEGKRSLRNSSDKPLVFMVIQSKQNSLNQYSTEDGERVQYEAKWNKSK